MELQYPQKPNGMYILRRDQMDDIAAMILGAYMPLALARAQPVDIDTLAQEGLALIVEDQILSRDDAILGLTAFEDVEDIPCFDETLCPIQIKLAAGTVLLHSSLQSRKNRARRRFTLAHECSHWVLHRSYHSPVNQKFKFRTQRRPYIACRGINADWNRQALSTDSAWEEWQADSLASALLMPLATFVPYANQFMVSQTAVKIRLRQFGLIQAGSQSPAPFYY